MLRCGRRVFRPSGHGAAQEVARPMHVRDLRALLDEVPDTRELVLRRAASTGSAWGGVRDAWIDAHEEGAHALRARRRSGSADAYAVYRAAQDREDAAQEALALAVAGERTAVEAGRERLIAR